MHFSFCIIKKHNMLLKDFYEIISLEISPDKDIAHAQLKINPEHNIFKGHFPGAPVVPCVCTIQMLREVLSKIINKELSLVSSDNIKFNNIINPLQNQVLNFDYKIHSSVKEKVNINCCISFEKTNFCTFKGEFKVGNDREESLKLGV